MITFSQITKDLNQERRDSLDNPKKSGFGLDNRGVTQKIIKVVISVRNNRKIKPLGNGFLCYSDQDIKENSPSAELIRSKRWKPYEVGWLRAMFNNQMINLAKIDPSTPSGKSLHRGFMTEQGQLIIDQKD